MISKKLLHFLTILIIGIFTVIHPTIGNNRLIYMKSDNSRPIPLHSTRLEVSEIKKPISMTIYYETLCPDSLDFFRNQLSPLLESLQKPGHGPPDKETNRLVESSLDPSTPRDPIDPDSFLDIHFIPYGKAVTLEKSKSYNFLCQHGPLECEGNRLHACTLEKVRRNTNVSPSEQNDPAKTQKLVNYFICTMKFLITPQDRDDPNVSPLTSLKSNNLTSFSSAALDNCFSELSNSTQLRTEIESCLKQDNGRGEGSLLLKKHGELTHGLNPQLYFVPWITFNGIWSKKNFEESRTDVKKVLCSLMTPQTVECHKYVDEVEQSKSKPTEKMVGKNPKISRKVAWEDRHSFFEGQEGHGRGQGGGQREGRGVRVGGSGEFAQNNKRRILMRRRPMHGRDRRGFLHGNNDMDLGGGGAAWRWRTNVHSNPGMEWRWRRPVAASQAMSH